MGQRIRSIIFIVLAAGLVYLLRPETADLGLIIKEKAHHALSRAANTKAIKGISKTLSGLNTERISRADLSVEGIISETNKEREALGLDALSYNPRLAESARMKVDDMIEKQYFEHESPDGKNVSDLGDAAGYGYVTVGENLAVGDFESDREIVAAWMESPSHRANMLNKQYQEIGIAFSQGTYEGEVVWFVVQHFGTPREVCPPINPALRQEIEKLKRPLQNLEKEILSLKEALEKPTASEDPYYHDYLEKYHTLVKDYEALVRLVQEKGATYNKTVQAFNRCLIRYQ